MITSVLSDYYKNTVVPQLKEKRGYKNPMEIPKLVKIVINTGVGTDKDREVMTAAVETLGLITGQKPVITKSRVNVSNFKLRKGMAVGASVTLRRGVMYNFLYRRELQFRFDGPVGLHRNRSGQDQAYDRHEHHHRDDGQDRRRSSRSSDSSGHAVCNEQQQLRGPIRGEEKFDSEVPAGSEVLKQGLFPLRALRTSACLHPQVPSVPYLFPRAGQQWPDSGCDEGQLVT